MKCSLSSILCAITLVAAPLGAQVEGKRPAITGLSHVVVLNDNAEASSRFYKDLVQWPETKGLEAGNATHYQISADQYIEVKLVASAKDPVDRVDHVAFETTNVEGMRKYLASNGVKVPDRVEKRTDGSSSFMVIDPEGYSVEFVQGGKFPPFSKQSISNSLIHVGMAVRNEATERHFYIDILGFRPYWAGWNTDEGHQDGVYDYKSLQVPEGTDWIEFMLLQGRVAGQAPWVRDPHHFAPGVVSIDDAFVTLTNRGLEQIAPDKRSHPQQGRDGKRQLNLFDPNGLRVELMNFKPNEKPCCTPFTGPQPEAPR
jgi:catechol 2,3-dioxygenase-like lactoylglutathione lyase family enzyme